MLSAKNWPVVVITTDASFNGFSVVERRDWPAGTWRKCALPAYLEKVFLPNFVVCLDLAPSLA